MIDAVPTTSPASVSEVWTGCLRNRSRAIPKTSRLNTAGLRLRDPHADAVLQGHRTRQDHGVALADSGHDLGLGQSEQPDPDLAPARAAAVQDVDEAAVVLPEDGRPRDDERSAL